jgi:NTE family protein
MNQPNNHSLNLALQGGGSHGAFTWGVLDALLEDRRIDIEGVSGTSAGAMNAVALAHGFAQALGKPEIDPREAARESLANFWNGIVGMGALGQAQRAPFDLLFGRTGANSSPTALWASAMTRVWSNTLSPYQSNPFDLNPLKDFVERSCTAQKTESICSGDACQHGQGRSLLGQAPHGRSGDGIRVPAHGVSSRGN